MCNLFNYPFNLEELLQHLDRGAFSHLSPLPKQAWLQLIQVRRQWSDQELARQLGLSTAELRRQKVETHPPNATERAQYIHLLLN